MEQLEEKETNWIIEKIVQTAETACKKSQKLLKSKEASDFESAVPKVRGNYKDIRAAFRLVRDENKNYKDENQFYRDEARKILEVQKAISMVKAIDLINEQYSDRLYKNAFTELRGALEDYKEKQIENALNEEHVFQEMHQNLDAKCANLKEMLSKPISRDAIISGLKRVYKRARSAKMELSESQTPEKFHELQKRANYLQIQLGLISPIWQEMIDVWESELEKLSQLVVTTEGLHQLSEFLRTNGSINAKEDGVYLMGTLVDGHREQVQKHALISAQRIFSLKTKDFAKFIDASWNAYESQTTQKILPSAKLKLSE